jgi:hypothetical protein
VRALIALALLGLAVAACAAAAVDIGHGGAPDALAAASAASPGSAAAPCAGASGDAAAHAAGVVAQRIYALELRSAEVRADRSQVEGSEPLLLAMASGEPAAIRSAVTALVFSGTHIVRLRVSAHGTLLSDVGGPYVLAPVGGVLRLHGRAVGSYLLSVQDDSGFVKLEQRFVGGLVLMRREGAYIPVEGTAPAPSGQLPASGAVSYHGSRYHVYTFDARAFPSGTLRIELLLSVVHTRPTFSCHQVALEQLGQIGETVWHRFQLVGGPILGFSRELASLTDALVYVRSGSQLLAGSTSTPPKLRDSGTLRFHGHLFTVVSFAARTPTRRVRVYQLFAG